MLSAKALYEYFEGKGSITPSIVMDIFGYLNWNLKMKKNKDDTLSLFIGVFKGLYNKGVTYREVYRCFLKNKLDDLIHIKFSIHPTYYYLEFVEKKIKIGKTFFASMDSNKDVVIEPLIYTIQPSFFAVIDNTFVNQELDENILDKIKCYKSQDKKKNRSINDEKYVTVDDVKRLLFKQENKCYVCGDVVQVKDWQSRCYCQFTLDRIDNSLPHNKDNVLICCFFCNCYSDGIFHDDILEDGMHQPKKTCKSCTTHSDIDRHTVRTRSKVPKEEIEKLKLNIT